MTTSGFTPGPWTYAGRLGYGHLIDPNIAVAYGGKTSGKSDSGEANAHLIAAAPDLLAAAKNLMASTYAENYRLISPFKELAAAIAKAEGRA